MFRSLREGIHQLKWACESPGEYTSSETKGWDLLSNSLAFGGDFHFAWQCVQKETHRIFVSLERPVLQKQGRRDAKTFTVDEFLKHV